MDKKYALLACGLVASPVFAGQMTVKVEIPRLRVAEYHQPYVALWLEDASGKAVANLAVWYDLDNREGGEKWLSELRTFWRRSGRAMKLPADGLTSPTRAPGAQTLTFTEGSGRLPKLAPGTYKLVIEAAREVGGREILTIPVQWPPKGAATASATGNAELGAVTLTVKP